MTTEGFRARRRAAAVHEILEATRTLVAADGADRLALRAVARALGMSPATLYEYFPGRDALLVALLAQTYERLAGELEQARDGANSARARFLAMAGAYRGWALAHPEEFRLLYASRVPGLQVAEGGTTTAAAARAGAVLRSCVAELTGSPSPSPQDPAYLSVLAPLHGAVMLELFGHLVAMGVDPEAAYDDLVRDLADRLEGSSRPG